MIGTSLPAGSAGACGGRTTRQSAAASGRIIELSCTSNGNDFERAVGGAGEPRRADNPAAGRSVGSATPSRAVGGALPPRSSAAQPVERRLQEQQRADQGRDRVAGQADHRRAAIAADHQRLSRAASRSARNRAPARPRRARRAPDRARRPRRRRSSPAGRRRASRRRCGAAPPDRPGALPTDTGTPPQAATKAASARLFELTIWCGPIGSPGMTISSPVDRMPTRGRRWTNSHGRFIAAARPMSRARQPPARRAAARRPRRNRARRGGRSGRAARLRRTRTRSPSRSVSSWMTIVSAPAGNGAPVKMRAASPAPTCPPNPAPAGTSATMRSSTGTVATSSARTA